LQTKLLFCNVTAPEGLNVKNILIDRRGRAGGRLDLADVHSSFFSKHAID
jgi:hypothetical protein